MSQPGAPARGMSRRAMLAGVGGTALLAGPLAGAARAHTGQQREHPFLLVSRDEFEALRRRAAQEPWATWRTTAAAKCAEPYDPTGSLNNRVRQLAQLAGACSLTYILDPEEHRSSHAARILELIDTFDSDLYGELDSGSWQGTVGASSAFFHLVLGLDVAYDDLSQDQVEQAEQKLGRAGEWFYAHREGSWITARIGAYGIWAVYTGDEARIAESMAALRQVHEQYTTPDGAIVVAPSYAGHRFGSRGDRDTKSYYVDILSRNGFHDYYTDPDYASWMEFLLGYVCTPVTRRVAGGGEERVERDQYTFGDCPVINGALWRSARTYSASRFGDVAARNAGWSLNRVTNNHVPGMITHYVLTEQAPLTGSTVRSRIYPRAGAWFLERDTSENALAGAMFNPVKFAQHQHDDTNAVHLCAYGEHVLRNSGYNGYGNGAGGFSWRALRRRAVVNNTVLIDYDRFFTDDLAPPVDNDHVETFGAGISEGFSGGRLDYASGDSGPALPNGTHVRNFVFVHPHGGAGGYWILVDEVAADQPGVPASVALHPNTDADPAVRPDPAEYTYSVGGPFPRSTNDVRLSIYLATPPDRVSYKPGPLAARDESFQGRYLYSSYGTDPAGRARIVTILFPHDQGHPKATMTRVSGPGFTGATIQHPGGPTDHALEAGGSTMVSCDGSSLIATAAVFRVDGGDLAWFFVRHGRLFARGGRGFESADSISVHLDGVSGHIVNPGSAPAPVTFRHPRVLAVQLDGERGEVLGSGPDWVRSRIPPGTFQLELVTSGQ